MPAARAWTSSEETVRDKPKIYGYSLPEDFICKRVEMQDTGMLYLYCLDEIGDSVVIMLKRGTAALVPLVVTIG